MGLLGGMARTAVVAGTATAVSNRVSRRQGRRWQQQSDAQQYQSDQQAQYAQPAPQQPAAPAAGGTSAMTAELERLAALKNSGVLSEQEFAAAKAKLLGL